MSLTNCFVWPSSLKTSFTSCPIQLNSSLCFANLAVSSSICSEYQQTSSCKHWIVHLDHMTSVLSWLFLKTPHSLRICIHHLDMCNLIWIFIEAQDPYWHKSFQLYSLWQSMMVATFSRNCAILYRNQLWEFHIMSSISLSHEQTVRNTSSAWRQIGHTVVSHLYTHIPNEHHTITPIPIVIPLLYIRKINH